MKKIVIVGAGTSGWLTASAIKRNCPDIDVTVIYDSSIPTIGVGETLNFGIPTFMRELLGITNSTWMNETKATYKTGIRLANWTAPGSFNQSCQINDFPADMLLTSSLNGIAQLKNSADRDSTDHYAKHGGIVDLWYAMYQEGLISDVDDLAASLGEGYHFSLNDKSTRDLDNNWLINENVGYSFHYNAEVVSNVVGDLVGRPAGVKEIDCKVVDVTVSNGRIESLQLADGRVVTSDLFIDCSGFKRLLVGKLDYHWEPTDEFYNNSAAVKQVEYDDVDNPVHRVTNNTTLAAMSSGWRFSVPLQNRSGNGYVFNSRITPDADKICAELDSVIESNKPGKYRLIQWDPGHYRDSVVGNCMALGIALGFSEPYDANNLAVTTFLIKDLVAILKRPSDNWLTDVKNTMNYKVNCYWEDVDMRVKSSLRLSPRRDTEYYRIMADAADKENLVEKFVNHIESVRVRDSESSQRYIWKSWAHILVASRYGIAVPNKPLDPELTELAKRYFEYNRFKYQLMAKRAPDVKDYYSKFFNNSK